MCRVRTGCATYSLTLPALNVYAFVTSAASLQRQRKTRQLRQCGRVLQPRPHRVGRSCLRGAASAVAVPGMVAVGWPEREDRRRTWACAAASPHAARVLHNSDCECPELVGGLERDGGGSKLHHDRPLLRHHHADDALPALLRRRRLDLHRVAHRLLAHAEQRLHHGALRPLLILLPAMLGARHGRRPCRVAAVHADALRLRLLRHHGALLLLLLLLPLEAAHLRLRRLPVHHRHHLLLLRVHLLLWLRLRLRRALHGRGVRHAALRVAAVRRRPVRLRALPVPGKQPLPDGLAQVHVH
mmetsp:Transcript_23118/g.59228  ORF Transcript_23118/g.59228 Transcript_23118/m.59228 type:complete len:299 (-) Transcript_23118:493-1389(-)